MTLFEVNEASSLVHEAAHEDANIIVGAVIDEALGEDELRVTVIATGLDGEEARRKPPAPPMPPEPRHRVPEESHEIAVEHAPVDAANVTPIRQEPAAAPVMQEEEQPVQAEQQVAANSGSHVGQNLGQNPGQAVGQNAEETAQSGAGFESPFEDELDTPAFLRRGSGSHTDDDRDIPAFMRRGNQD